MARRETNLVVVHSSATPPSMDIGRAEIDRWHRQRGWLMIGYHYVIRRDGEVELGRPVMDPGAHALGYNSESIGICLVGGVDDDHKPDDNFTDEQHESLVHLHKTLTMQFPEAEWVGHNELADTSCPSFDVQEWLGK